MVINVVGLSKNRIESFSDGVIAIVITLLIFQIQVPHVLVIGGDESVLVKSVIAYIPKFISYAVSFVVLSVWWVAHHQLFHTIEKIDRNLLWINNLFLMCLCLIPFPSALIGDYPGTRTGAFLFGLVVTCTASVFFYMRWYISIKAKLIKDEIPYEAIKRSLSKSIMSPVLHGIGTCVAVIAPSIALAIYAILAIYFVFPMKLEFHLIHHHHK